jgi:hypothetical protein
MTTKRKIGKFLKTVGIVVVVLWILNVLFELALGLLPFFVAATIVVGLGYGLKWLAEEFKLLNR